MPHVECTSVARCFSPSGCKADELSLHSNMGVYSASTTVTYGHGIILMQFENISSLLELNIRTGIVGNIGMGPCYLSGQLLSGAMIFREVFYHNDLKVCP